MKKTQKLLAGITILYIMAFSLSAASLTNAATATLPFQSGQLATPNVLTVDGGSEIAPIAGEEIGPSSFTSNGGFTSYWNSLVAANPSWGTAANLDLTSVSLSGLSDGIAIPELNEGAADVGEMSRFPSSSEWSAPSMANMQICAVGVDGLAIVVSSTMTWFPKNLTTLQVAQLFADNNPSGTQTDQGLTGATGSTPLYSTWGDFLAAYYAPNPIPAIINGVPTAYVVNDPIERAVMDPASGAFACFNNYFAVPNGYQFENLAVTPTSNGQETIVGTQEMAPYTYCQENINEYLAASETNYIGFISLGYLNTYGNMISLNIAYNIADSPSSITSYDSTTVWGPYVAPTNANVIYAYPGFQDADATGQYMAWTYLWEVTPAQIPSTGPLLATGVWIAYMREYGTTQGGSSDFAKDQGYIDLNPADMAGGQVLDSTLQPYQPLAGQTQTVPDGQVNFSDVIYFVSAYINYYAYGIYNPYADINADGRINFSDVLLFVSAYEAAYTSYNP